MEKIEAIKGNDVYLQVLKDSFGGIMYDVANEWKYNTEEIQKIVLSMETAEKNSMDGIMKGALNFLKIL